MQEIFRTYIQEQNKFNKQNKPNYLRSNIKPGLLVYIVKKEHQKQGILTKGIVKDILTSKSTHTQGIKVRLMNGMVGRVQCIIGKQKCNFKKENNVVILNESLDDIGELGKQTQDNIINTIADNYSYEPYPWYVYLLKFALVAGVTFATVRYLLTSNFRKAKNTYNVDINNIATLIPLYFGMVDEIKTDRKFNSIEHFTKVIYPEFVEFINKLNDSGKKDLFLDDLKSGKIRKDFFNLINTKRFPQINTDETIYNVLNRSKPISYSEFLKLAKSKPLT